MEELYIWVESIAGYCIFLAVVLNLIPGKKYEKYIRLFTGMVAILLIMQPLTGKLRLEERLAHLYEALIFQYQSEDLKAEIWEIGEQRLQNMICEYEKAAEDDVKIIAEDMGLTVLACQVEIGREEGSKQFGMVERVRMEVCLKMAGGDDAGKEDGSEEKGKGDIGVWEKARIEPVVIKKGGERLAAKKEENGGKNGDAADSEREEDFAIGKLRRKIMSYYDLEEAYVEIQVVEG